MKSGTDSGGFDSPRSSRAGSPKRPGKKRGGGGGEGVRVSGNKSICGVVRAGGGSDSRHHGLFEVYTRTPSFLPQKLCFLRPRSHFLLVAALQPRVSRLTRRRRVLRASNSSNFIKTPRIDAPHRCRHAERGTLFLTSSALRAGFRKQGKRAAIETV